MTLQELPPREEAAPSLLEEQQLLDFGQPMLLVLSRDLHVSHNGLRVLLVETRRGGWLVLPQSDYYFIQQLKTPTSLDAFVQANQWLPEPFLHTVVLYMYARGFLEVNGSSIWEPPARPLVPPMARLVDVRLDEATVSRTCAGLGRSLSRLLDEDPRPLEVSLRSVGATIEPIRAMLDQARTKADRRGVPFRVSLFRSTCDAPPPFLDLARDFSAQVTVGDVAHGAKAVRGDARAAAQALRALEGPYRVLLPWSQRAALLPVIESGAPCVGFTFDDAARERVGRKPAEEMLAMVDQVLERDLPPFIWTDVTPLLTRLMQFPWHVGSTECSGFHAAALVADADGRCYPCETLRDRHANGRGRLDSAQALRKLGTINADHESIGVRKPWWRTFHHACPGVYAGPDPRGRFYATLVEGLIWRTTEHTHRLLAQLGVNPPQNPEAPDVQ